MVANVLKAHLPHRMVLGKGEIVGNPGDTILVFLERSRTLNKTLCPEEAAAGREDIADAVLFV